MVATRRTLFTWQGEIITKYFIHPGGKLKENQQQYLSRYNTNTDNENL